MKNFLSSIYVMPFLLSVACSKTKQIDNNNKQSIDSITSKHERFEHKDGDTIYVMQKYFLVLLKKGPNRDQSKEELDKIMTAHLKHLSDLNKMGKISLAGPSENHDTVSGFVLFNTETQKEADSLANLDPAVKAGRLVVEVLPWWAAKGSKLK